METHCEAPSLQFLCWCSCQRRFDSPSPVVRWRAWLVPHVRSGVIYMNCEASDDTEQSHESFVAAVRRLVVLSLSAAVWLANILWQDTPEIQINDLQWNGECLKVARGALLTERYFILIKTCEDTKNKTTSDDKDILNKNVYRVKFAFLSSKSPVQSVTHDPRCQREGAVESCPV